MIMIPAPKEIENYSLMTLKDRLDEFRVFYEQRTRVTLPLPISYKFSAAGETVTSWKQDINLANHKCFEMKEFYSGSSMDKISKSKAQRITLINKGQLVCFHACDLDLINDLFELVAEKETHSPPYIWGSFDPFKVLGFYRQHPEKIVNLSYNVYKDKSGSVYAGHWLEFRNQWVKHYYSKIFKSIQP